MSPNIFGLEGRGFLVRFRHYFRVEEAEGCPTRTPALSLHKAEKA